MVRGAGREDGFHLSPPEPGDSKAQHGARLDLPESQPGRNPHPPLGLAPPRHSSLGHTAYPLLKRMEEEREAAGQAFPGALVGLVSTSPNLLPGKDSTQETCDLIPTAVQT